MAQLVIIKNAFEPWNGRVVKNVPAGTKFSDIIIDNNLIGIELRVVSNGNELTEVDDYVVCENDIITVSPIVGKGGGKKLFGIIAMIGISIATAGAASAILGATHGVLGHTFLGYLAVAAVSTVGAFLCNAIQTKMMGNQNVSAYETYDNDQTYGWNGVQTMEGQNNPITMTYGKVKSGGQSIGKYIKTQDDKEYLNWLISAGEGELTFSDIKINDNPVEYYNNVQVETRSGTNDQSVISNFNDTYFTKELNYQLLDSPVTDTVQGSGTQGIIVKLECSNGLYYANDDGGLGHAWVDFIAEYRNKDNGQWKQLASERIGGSQSSAIRRELRVDNLVEGEYEVRVTVKGRSHSVTNSRASTRIWWTSVTSIVYDDFCYPNIALLSLKALATDQLSGSANVTFVKERAKVWVFNTDTNQYEQRNANNPAWACYDFLHLASRLKNINTGAYEFEVRGVPAKSILYNQFKEWADFCDTKNLHVNVEITQIGEMLETVNNSIASIGRGIVIRFGTKYGCVWDSVKQPVQMFGMGNILAGTFKEDFLPTNDRANAVEVTFVNAEHDYGKEVVTIYGDNYDTDATEKMSQVSYLGITSYEQAYREAKYQLYSNQYLIRTVTFQANVDAIACTVGDVIMVAHDVPMWAKSGRIFNVDVPNRTVTLPIELDDISGAYRLMYRTVNDNIYTVYADIIGTANGYTTVKSKTDFNANDLPQENDIFDFALVEIGSKPFTVKEISRASDFTRNISCIEYNENIYNERYDIPAINYSGANNIVPTVYNLIAVSNKYSSGNGYAYRLEANWECDKECTYNVYLSNNGETWSSVANGIRNKDYVADITPSTKYIKVIAYDRLIASRETVALIDTKDYVAFPSVRNVVGYSRYRELTDNVARYDVCVEWERPLNFPPYMQAQVWYKSNTVQANFIGAIPENVPANLVGYQGDWIYGGQGYTSAVISQAIIGDTYEISVCVQDTSGVVQMPDEGVKVSVTVKGKTEIPNTPNNLSVSVSDMFNIKWDEVRNSDIKYYEIRTDSSVGVENSNFIGRTTESRYSTDLIKERVGRVLVYAVNVYGKYSSPAIVDYNYPAPKPPTKIEVVSKFQSIELSVDSIPNTCLGIHWFVENEDFKTDMLKRLYSVEAGVYLVNACYYDYFGDGTLYDTESNGIICVIKATIDPALIDSESITVEKLSADAQEAINNGGAKTANVVASGILGTGAALVMQENGSYALVASNGQKLTGLFANQDGVIRLQGKYMHLTGDTVIDGNIITKNMLQAGAVTAEKIDISNGSQKARVAITSNLIRVYDSNGTLRVQMGVW